jgi:hypothetical protein
MSHFEYVSVATALIYALAVGRLLGGLSGAMHRSRRYWIQLGWVIALLLVCVMSWWIMWSTRDVDWTPLRFLCALALPALIFVRATVLLGASDELPDSYRDHFYNNRRLFFALGMIAAVFIALVPWFLGTTPWLTLGPVHANAASLFVVSAIGFYNKNPRVHAVLVIFSLMSSVYSFLFIPLPTSGV